MKEFSAVLFDFDGVLVDTEWAIYQAWVRVYQAQGHDLPLEIYTRCIGSDFATWSPKSHLENLTGAVPDWDHLDAVRRIEVTEDLETAGPMHGVVGCLEELRDSGIPLMVVSSSGREWVDGWLARLDLLGYFAGTVCRGDAPAIKPAPDLFLAAAARLGVPPSRCLVVEDSRNGLLAARAAGMTVWAVPNRVTAGVDFTGAARVLGSLAEWRKVR